MHFVDSYHHLVRKVAGIEGDVVECGTWRGGMIAGIADVLGPSRGYWLRDSFEGLPLVGEIDGPRARAWQADVTGPYYYDNCRASVDDASSALNEGAKNQ
jgi:O-methyltransferase